MTDIRSTIPLAEGAKILELDKDIAANLRKIRLAKRVSQAKLAEFIGVTAQQVQKYERAQNRISAARLYYIALCLDTPLTDFYQKR